MSRFDYVGPEPGAIASLDFCRTQYVRQGSRVFEGRLMLVMWNNRYTNILRMGLRIEALLVAARVVIKGDYTLALIHTQNWRSTTAEPFGFCLSVL